MVPSPASPGAGASPTSDARLPNGVTPEAWAQGFARVQETAAAERGTTDRLTPALYTTINIGRNGGERVKQMTAMVFRSRLQ